MRIASRLQYLHGPWHLFGPLHNFEEKK